MEQEFEESIDVVTAKRFFKYISNDLEVTDLKILPIDMPKTLRTLINIGYASDYDRHPQDLSSIHCSRCTKYYGTEEVVGSNCSSSNRSSSNINLKDWSQVFAEDGRFRFDEILPLLDPSPDFTKKELGYYNQTVECARWALSSYNQQNGVGYEFVAPMLSNVLFIKEPQRTYGFHANFFAKLKNTDSPLELFFAEVVACGLSRGQVVKCCILTPQLCGSSPVAMASDFAMILHPEYMRCDQCNRDMVPYDSSDSD